MPFSVIRGSFHLTGYSPDGDSARFKPDNPNQILALNGPRADFNNRGHVQLRFEGIDALETHFSVGSTSFHQPPAVAEAARNDLLNYLGFKAVVWSSNRSTVVSADDGQPGYILAREVEKNRRPVAFVFRGTPPEDMKGFLKPDALKLSYNYLSVAAGLSYVTFYNGLFFDLRNTLIAAATAARAAGHGVYSIDKTQAGFDGNDLAALSDTVGIMPKLFRRVVEYVTNTGSIAGFKQKMELSAEPVLDLADANFTHFDTVIQQEGNIISLSRTPEQLVFDAMPTKPVNAFSALLAADPNLPGGGIAPPTPALLTTA